MANRLVQSALLASVAAIALCDAYSPATATPIVWSATPPSSDWNTAVDWQGGVVPGAGDTAVFQATTQTAIGIQQANTQISALQFDAGAPAYTFNITGTAANGASSLIVGGAGIVNASSFAPNFVVGGVAGNGGALEFDNAAVATGATLTANAFGTVVFTGTSNAGSATLAVNSGGVIDFSGTLGPAGDKNVSAAAIAGSGTISLGGDRLTIGGGNASSFFSGVIADGGISGGTGASVVKTGTGTLTFVADQTYTGVTTVSAGTLQLGAGGAGYLAGDIVDNAAVIINLDSAGFPNSKALASNISGTGTVTVTGGLRILSGTNTYTGGTTITNGSTLRVGNGGATGSIVGNVSIATGGALALIRSGTLVLDGVISGAGRLDQSGVGTTILTGTNTYMGGTNIINGTLQIGNGGTTGSITGNVINQFTLVFDRSDSYTFSGSITSGGQLLQNGSGTTILTANDTYAGGTTINAGTLQLGNGGTTGAILGDVADNGTLAFDRSNTLTFAGAISGGGALTQIGTGTTILTGTNTYAGGTTISAGTLQIGNGGTTGSIVGNIGDNGTLAINRSDSLTLAGLISGTGGLRQIGSGMTFLTANDTYAGGTTITGGTLVIGQGGTSGAIAGNVTGSGFATLAFNRSDAVVIGNTIAGDINLAVFQGTVTLTGTNTYTGNTTVGGMIGQSATLAIASNANLGGVNQFYLRINGFGTLKALGDLNFPQSLLVLGGSGDSTIDTNGHTITQSGQIYDYTDLLGGPPPVGPAADTLVKTGLGTLNILSGNTYTGATVVNGGTLAVNGAIALSNQTTVNAGGTLAGGGTVGKTTIASGGIIAPGNGGPATLYIAGPLSFASGANYAAEVSATAHDLLTVTGSASLGGTLTASSLGGAFVSGDKIPLLTAWGGVSNTFTLVAVGSFNSLVPSLVYDADDVFLLLSTEHLTPNLPANAPLNARNVTGGIDAAAAQGDTMPAAFVALASLSPTALQGAATQLSGEVSADLPEAGVALLNPFLVTVLDRFGDLGSSLSDATFAGASPQLASGDPSPASPRPASASGSGHLWLSVGGGHGTTDGDPTGVGSHNVSTGATGVTGGFDVLLGSQALVGAAISAGHASFKLSDGLGIARSNALQGGIYGTVRFGGAAYISAVGAYGQHDMATSRFVTVSGVDHLVAKFTAENFGGRIEGGYRFGFDTLGVTPYLALQAETFELPAYSETAQSGAATFALGYAAHDTSTTRVELGVNLDHDFALGGGDVFHLFGRSAWAHDNSSAQDAQALFLALPGSGFTVHGAAGAEDAALFALGAEVRSAGNFSFGARMDGLLSDHATSYFGTATLSYAW
jgi:fibronectin-binding autotransporter adhesin